MTKGRGLTPHFYFNRQHCQPGGGAGNQAGRNDDDNAANLNPGKHPKERSGDQAVNNILEYKMGNLQLEGETDKLLPSPAPLQPSAPLQTPADNEGSVAHIVNNICLWCLEDTGFDHPSLCDRPAVCLKFKRTGHGITDCRSAAAPSLTLARARRRRPGAEEGGRIRKTSERTRGRARRYGLPLRVFIDTAQNLWKQSREQ